MFADLLYSVNPLTITKGSVNIGKNDWFHCYYPDNDLMLANALIGRIIAYRVKIKISSKVPRGLDCFIGPSQSVQTARWVGPPALARTRDTADTIIIITCANKRRSLLWTFWRLNENSNICHCPMPIRLESIGLDWKGNSAKEIAGIAGEACDRSDLNPY